MSKLLTPNEVLQALQDGRNLEFKHPGFKKWTRLNPLDNPLSLENIFKGGVSFRLAQEMITIGDVSFPKPESEPLTCGTMYYIAYLDNLDPYLNYVWRDTIIDRRRLKTGLVHLSRENAIAHAKALIKLSGGECE